MEEEQTACRRGNIQVELVSPAGTLEKLRIAVLYGADAVYLSGKEYGLRSNAGNFTVGELEAGVAFAHEKDCKVYVGVNVFARNRDLDGVAEYSQAISKTGVDAVIVADPGVFAIVREHAPRVRIHISTQANVTNWQGVEFWRSLGADRIILSRELTLDEIAEIAAKSTAEIEVFVHGAMCVAYSGRCLLSAHLSDRSANLGDCAQPCRWAYRILPEGEADVDLAIEEDERGTYLLSSADLCLVEHLDALTRSGVAAVKIEGRMKSLYYVAAATRIYREALEASRQGNGGDGLKRKWLEELSHLTKRGYTTGFTFDGGAADMREDSPQAATEEQRFLGLILEDSVQGLMKVRAFNRIQAGQQVQIMSFRRKDDRTCTVREMWGTDGERIEKAGGGKVITLRADSEGMANEILRTM